MANWNVKETLGTSYIYCSKNAVDDVAASNFFGKAAAWVSGAAVVINQRVTSVSIQYYNKTGVNTTTAPASDITNWGIDKANFQPYIATQTYNIGDECTNTTHHWVCAVNGTTGAFNPANWTDTIISNSSAPYKLMNTAIVMMNANSRFVSSEVLDTVNNIATQLIWIVLSNGIWNETLTTPTKVVRFVGQSNLKTQFSVIGLGFYDTIYMSYGQINDTQYIKAQNCNINMAYQTGGNSAIYSYFSYRNIFSNFGTQNNSPGGINHMVSCTILNWAYSTPASALLWYSNSIFRNNYIKGTNIELGLVSNGLNGLNQIQVGSFDYNCYDGIVKLNGVVQTTISTLRTSVINQNNNSIFSTVTLNSDYTIQPGSALVGAGSNGNNIGAEGIGYLKTTSDIWDSASGATYKNIIKSGSTLIRDQISKLAQGGGSNYIILNNSASSIDNTYNSFRVYISAGTGAGQTRTALASAGYVGSTRTLTVTVNWAVNPDNTSIYELLDGTVISAIGDLVSVMTIKKFNFNTSNIMDVTGYIIIQSVSESDPRSDYPAALTFDLKVSNDPGLAGAITRRFIFDDYLKIDNADKGCGDAAFNPANLVSNTLTFRYYQITINLQK